MASLIEISGVQHKKLLTLYDIPQTEQKSEAWLNLRKNYLTSSDAGTALGLNHYQKPVELLFQKCGVGKPFSGNVATKWGEKYEDEAVDMYCNSMCMKQHEFGLIPFESVVREVGDICIDGSEILAGSPDGIALPLEDLVSGEPVLLEVKCPYRRSIIPGKCPEHYYPQVQLNMYICNVSKAAFIEYDPRVSIESGGLNIVHYDRDDVWLHENVPKLKEFWNTVIYYRENGIITHPEYKKYAWTPEKAAALEERQKKRDVPQVVMPCMLSDDEN